LTEDFRESRVYRPIQLNQYYQTLYPFDRSTLKQQFLCTPMYLKDSWLSVLKQGGSRMQPRLILINDNEHIPHKNRTANVYVQYVYKNDAVLGADKAYQLMLPDRGPTEPARPLLISPAKFTRAQLRRMPRKPELALREAPVFVYHAASGHAFYENLAQYLAGRQAKLSPRTARKLLQFSDCREFEDYLAAKITRDEAKRLAFESGSALINVDAIRNNLLTLLDDPESIKNREYYHFGCDYDPLRPQPIDINAVRGSQESLYNDTKEYVINGVAIKSTFIALKDNDELERVNYDQMPADLINVVDDEFKTPATAY
jgi:hypothetical protein